MAVFTVFIHVDFGKSQGYDGEGYIKKTFNKEVIPRFGENVKFKSVALSLMVSDVEHNLEENGIEVNCDIGSELDAFDLFLQGGWEYESAYINEIAKEDEEKFLEFVEKRRQKNSEQKN